jgi:hypothetical protein
MKTDGAENEAPIQISNARAKSELMIEFERTMITQKRQESACG